MTAIPAWIGDELAPVGKLAVHRLGLRHKAVSVFLLDSDRLLIQRRAAGKYHSAGLWANTCCTHPKWGERGADCAARRLGEELGLRAPVDLTPRGVIEYRAEVDGRMVEHEVVEVFVGTLPATTRLAPDPAEVADLRWVDLAALRAEVEAEPSRFTAWLAIYLRDHAAQIFAVAPA